MTKKEAFIKVIQTEIFDRPDIYSENYPDLWEDVCMYWDALKGKAETEKPMFTDNGKLILKFLQEHQETLMWKARDIAEGLFISSRAVSGAMRKLVTDGFVEKVGQDPVIYSITDNGKNIDIE
jgi:DNA-binding MarR family transcriptional regulator